MESKKYLSIVYVKLYYIYGKYKISRNVFKDKSIVIMYKCILWLDMIQGCYIYFIILYYRVLKYKSLKKSGKDECLNLLPGNPVTIIMNHFTIKAVSQ